ncbi:MAG TPA: glycosyltransferase family 9 protein [Longimicrobiales bacterium]
MPGGLIVRAPNHLGDLVLALPALEAAGGADVMVLRSLSPLLELAGLRGRILPLDRGARGFLAAARRLRRGRYERGVLLPPSFSSALLFAAGGVAERRGTATDGRAVLLTEPVDPAELAGCHRSVAYFRLVTGRLPARPLVPHLPVPEPFLARWRELAGAASRPVIGIFPGSKASSRRWDLTRHAELARRLAARGARVVVFGGPEERELTAVVAGDWAFDAGGRTDLGLLAAGLAACDVLVTNDSGPMHLAAAVGTPTISLWGAGDPNVTGPLGEGHLILRHPELPCVPCVKNECPRRGRGYVLEEAERECLRLIQVADVEAVLEARGTLRGSP